MKNAYRIGKALPNIGILFHNYRRGRWAQMIYRIRSIYIIFFVFITTAVTVSAQANSIILAWDPNNPAEQVTEYRIYYKTGASGPPYQGTGIDQGNSPIIIRVRDLANENMPRVNLSGLIPFATYHFTLTAFNGYESAYSDEVSLPVQALNPGQYTGRR